jgi:tRNA A37 threonylcarbamoyladenosine synthetase subunit TsaC/SUA5/YrdC
MAQYFQIHPDNPQKRLIHQAVDIIQQGGIVILPTDSSYAMVCQLDNKKALDRIRRIRQLSEKHDFTLLCFDLAQVSNFTKIGNDAFRLIKSLTPGPFTFILDATKEVPRRLQPLCSSTLILPNKDEAETDPYELRDRLEHELDLIIDYGIIEFNKTTIIDCSDNKLEIIRQGIGQAPMLESAS